MKNKLNKYLCNFRQGAERNRLSVPKGKLTVKKP